MLQASGSQSVGINSFLVKRPFHGVCENHQKTQIFALYLIAEAEL